MDVGVVFRVVMSRKEKGEERVGVGGRGKYGERGKAMKKIKIKEVCSTERL
jgi:hypothetical protein